MEERRYRAYITDTLQAINANFVKRYGGSYIKERWADGIAKKQDTRSGDDIAADVIRRAGLRLGQLGAEDNGI